MNTVSIQQSFPTGALEFHHSRLVAIRSASLVNIRSVRHKCEGTTLLIAEATTEKFSAISHTVAHIRMHIAAAQTLMSCP